MLSLRIVTGFVIRNATARNDSRWRRISHGWRDYCAYTGLESMNQREIANERDAGSCTTEFCHANDFIDVSVLVQAYICESWIAKFGGALRP